MLALPLPNIPKELSALRTIALDLRWTWSHEADTLWEQVDEKLCRPTCNPWTVLQNATEQRLRELAADGDFCRQARILRRRARRRLQPRRMVRAARMIRPR